ncbi:MAG TPA: sigma-70 family RNA polymerase sigma factor [Ktedonobacteraceae bacterium]|nr:sigma-70 family RNA polymerase sigma factor [Ktedonobacteraceae bacterium]
MTNLALDYCRRKNRIEFLSWPESKSENPADYILSGYLSEPGHEEQICSKMCLELALPKMSYQYRVCLLLRELWELSYQEIARALGISESAVRANVSRAHHQLRDLCRHMMEEQITIREEEISHDTHAL